jgi:hypothetical protein
MKSILVFVFASLLLCAAVFRDALWGGSIAAPVDIAPTLWAHYGYVAPGNNGIPQNHYIVDQLSYDLPLQWTMHQSWRRGEVPWWNPYTFSGRPLLADAHCNGTDPIRVAVYLAVPDFVLAYNWTLILHSMLMGLGLFVLLCGFGTRSVVAGSCALVGQWAGCNTLFIGHPWIEGAFLYYPWLWLAWHRGLSGTRHTVSAAIAVAGTFYAGNLQSHAYLPLFSLAVALGYAGMSRKLWHRVLCVFAPGLILGAMLASPVLLAELELYSRNVRILTGAGVAWLPQHALMALAAVHPWALGTFRTVGLSGYSFLLSIGGAGMILAALGWARRREDSSWTQACRSAGWLAAVFIFILATPLESFLYTRAAGLGLLGLIVLAARGVESLLREEKPLRCWACVVLTGAALITLGTHALAYIIYPYLKDWVTARMEAHAAEDPYGGTSTELRRFQVRNFAHEVTFQNPEALANCLAIALLGLLLLRQEARRPASWIALFALNITPLILFSMRFVPHSSVEMWKLFRAGGPLQKQTIEGMGDPKLRLNDDASLDFLHIFPMESAVLHGLHVLNGYAALQPANQMDLPTNERWADFYIYTQRDIHVSQLTPKNTLESAGRVGLSRFFWKSGSQRLIKIRDESLCSLNLDFPPGPADTLVRTDTYYPGWKTEPHITVHQSSIRPFFSEIDVPASCSTVRLNYSPRGQLVALCAATLASLVLLTLSFTRNPTIREGSC